MDKPTLFSRESSISGRPWASNEQGLGSSSDGDTGSRFTCTNSGNIVSLSVCTSASDVSANGFFLFPLVVTIPLTLIFRSRSFCTAEKRAILGGGGGDSQSGFMPTSKHFFNRHDLQTLRCSLTTGQSPPKRHEYCLRLHTLKRFFVLLSLFAKRTSFGKSPCIHYRH